jgi:hypothetical protein
MLNKEAVNKILNQVLSDDLDHDDYIERCSKVLVDPTLFVKVANKWILLSTIKNLKMLISETNRKINDSINPERKEIMSSVYYMTTKHINSISKIESCFNEKFNCKTNLTIKLLEWKRFIHSLDKPIPLDVISNKLNCFNHKAMIDYELVHYDYLERLNEWLNLVKHMEDIFSSIYTEKWVDHI